MNETQLWYCDMCDKTNRSNSKLKHPNCKTHIHKFDCGIVVTEIEINKPKIDKRDCIFKDVIKDCEVKFLIHLKIDVFMIIN